MGNLTGCVKKTQVFSFRLKSGLLVLGCVRMGKYEEVLTECERIGVRDKDSL